jgi:hypothetical protein
MGYIEETGIAQMLRDARIAMIYEGTSGIQALDLVGRKLTIAGGRLPAELFEELRGELRALDAAGEMTLHRSLSGALATVEEATSWLRAEHDNDPDAAAAGATPYLRLFATTLGGFLLARSALAARGTEFADSKRASAAFFIGQLLPPATALLPAITAGSASLSSEAFA